MTAGVRTFLRGAIAAAAVLALFSAPGRAQEGFLHPVPATEAASLLPRLMKSLLPSHTSEVRVEAKQVFRLIAAGQPDLLLVPVHFEHGEPSSLDTDHTLAERDRCGVFLLPSNGPQSFVYTVTGQDDWAVDQCGKLLAVRRRPHNGSRPELTLTYSTFSPPRFEDKWFVTLTWDTARNTYQRTGTSEAAAAP